MMRTEKIQQIFHLNAGLFQSFCMDFLFHQHSFCPLYREYTNALHLKINQIKELTQIPFLPIRFFKNHEILCTNVQKSDPRTKPLLFESSGTTGQFSSKHFVADFQLYQTSFRTGFEYFYGPLTDYCILGLLPSYLERTNSSLVYMVENLITGCGQPLSGFFLNDREALYRTILKLESAKQKTLLWGVTYALLDFAESFPLAIQSTTIIETGGMKGRRAEMIRDDVHQILKKHWGVSNVHSEYGMTELLSQAYSKKDGIFSCPPWMKVLVRDVNDPLEVSLTGKGALNIIDLANIHSCCFIATDDIGEVFGDGSFKVYGRLDDCELRGCSLLYEP